MMSLAVGSVVMLLVADFAEARRGGRMGGAHRMSRGGPAASGSFNRSRARPSVNRGMNRGMNRDLGRGMDRGMNRGMDRDLGRDVDLGRRTSQPVLRDPGPGTGQTRPGDRDPDDRLTRPGEGRPGDGVTRPGEPGDGERPTIDPDRADEIKDNRQDRVDDRQQYLDDRNEYYSDRNEWYEDRWRAGAYVSVVSWNSMNCGFNTVIIGAVTYYMCDGIRYERVYRGSEVIYIVAD
jgi:hypothetical protein